VGVIFFGKAEPDELVCESGSAFVCVRRGNSGVTGNLACGFPLACQRSEDLPLTVRQAGRRFQGRYLIMISIHPIQ